MRVGAETQFGARRRAWRYQEIGCMVQKVSMEGCDDLEPSREHVECHE